MFRNQLRDASEFNTLEKKQMLKNKLVSKLVNAQVIKRDQALNKLTVHADQLKRKERSELRRRMNFLNYLISGSRGKLFSALETLRENYLGAEKMELINKLKRENALHVIVNQISRGRKGRMSDAVGFMQQNSRKYLTQI